MSKDNEKIGANIKKFRKEQRYTQKELGQLIGKTESSIQKYESGATEVPRSVLESIASVLGLHLLDLLDDASAMDWFAKRDRAAISFLNSIGCHVQFLPSSRYRADSISLVYDGVHYVIPTDRFFDFIERLESKALDLISDLVKYTDIL